MRSIHPTLALGARLLAGLAFTAGLAAANAAEAESYTYDVLGRITSVTTDSGVTTYYCYDPAGNRTYVGPTACS